MTRGKGISLPAILLMVKVVGFRSSATDNFVMRSILMVPAGSDADVERASARLKCSEEPKGTGNINTDPLISETSQLTIRGGRFASKNLRSVTNRPILQYSRLEPTNLVVGSACCPFSALHV